MSQVDLLRVTARAQLDRLLMGEQQIVLAQVLYSLLQGFVVIFIICALHNASGKCGNVSPHML